MSASMPTSVEPSSATVPSVPASWRPIFFAPLGDGRRRRRGSDGVRLALAIGSVLAALLVLRSNSYPEDVVTHALSPPPLGVRWLVDVFWIGGSFGTIAFLLLLAGVARRWIVLRDLAVAAAGTLVVSGVLVLALGASGGRPPSVRFDGYILSFPVLHVALAIGVGCAALPYLSRSVQRLIEVVVFLAALATVVAGHGLPANVLGSMAIGWGVAAALHLGWGSPSGLPSAEELRAALATIGIDARSVTPSAYQTWGAAHYTALTDGGALGVTFYGRDASDAQLLGKLYRFVLYRNSGPALSLKRVQQVEHESSLTQLAGRAGVRVPDVVSASEIGESHDAALITRVPTGSPLADTEPDRITDRLVDDLFAQLLKLRAVRISHGAIGPHTVVADTDRHAVTLIDFRNGIANADDFLLDQDLAGAIASAALAVGADRTVRSILRTVPTGVVTGTLSHLRLAGLDPSITIALKGKRDLLNRVRTQTAEAATIAVPKLVEPRRLSWNQVLVAAGSLVGGWALILVLINASHSIDTIRHAAWGWVAVTAILCWISFPAMAVSASGSVPGALPLGRVVGLELSSTFTTLAGGNPAVLATHVRFYQQEGYDTTVAVTSSALVGAASLVVKLVLFVIALPFAWSSFHFGRNLHKGAGTNVLWGILAVVVAIGAVIIVVMAVPRWRRRTSEKLRPKIGEIVQSLKDAATQPAKFAQLVGGQIAGQLCIILALGAALRAFGGGLSLAALVIASTMAGVLAAASPAGGGMGVAEAGLILALTAASISNSEATAAVFVQRLFAAYLPPIVGWVTLMAMRRRELL
jgi:uncharacterized membrane protein YbhN (UPF0104 family)